MDYQKLCEGYASYGCQLLSTEDEIKKQMEGSNKGIDYQKLRFVSKCGHASEGYFVNLRYKGTDVNCRKCAYKEISVKATKRNDTGREMEMEHEGFRYIEDILKASFEVKKTNEGCLADCIVRPIGSTEDKWLMIQLKTTQQATYGLYSFALHNNWYEHCVMALICLENRQTWIMDGNIIKHLKSKLNIAIGKSKYNEYLADHNIDELVSKFYETKQLYPEDHCLCPISIQQQQEQIYRRVREDKLPFLSCEYPAIEALKHDFTVNGIKIQEKVATKRKDRSSSYVVAFDKTYKQGMNKYYWLNIPNSNVFYIIPEE